MGRTIVKMNIGSDWSILGGIMKANFNKRLPEEY